MRVVDKIPRSVATHDGTFHADEVTACALLALFDLIDEERIVRTRDPAQWAHCEYVCDVGGKYDPSLKLFDHHQAEYDGAWSSAGMVLFFLLSSGHMSAKEYECLNQGIILGVDAHDNGKDPLLPGYCTVSHIVSSFNPLVYEADATQQMEAFLEAFRWIKGLLERMLGRFRYTHSAKEIVERAMSRSNEYLDFDVGIPWLEAFFELGGASHPASFVIMPSGGHWKLRGIPPSYEQRLKVRVPLPLEWAGLLDDDLKRATGIPGAIFCHKGRFTSVWETKKDALKALEYVMRSRS